MSQRFQFPGKYAMRPVKNGKGNVLAYFTTVDTEIGIEFRDVRLIEGKNGVFVAAPFRSYEKDGKTEYSDFWRAAYDVDAEARDERGVKYVEEMAQAAFAKYQEAMGGEASAPRGSDRGASSSAPSGARRSGRGPVNRPSGVSADNKSGLPF
jgi:DNA-binding cell septation regulator SpoVG